MCDNSTLAEINCPPGKIEEAGLTDRFPHSTIAIVYDFDGTLTPQPMQEYTILPKLGLSSKRFWNDVKAETAKTHGDEMLTYMRLLIERLEDQKEHLSKKDLRMLANNIKYFPGIPRWFERISKHVKRKSGGRVKIRNYVISAGQRELLEGTSIRKFFHRVFASEYYFNHHGVATFSNVLINDTGKTQYIFRINKGREEPEETINEYTPESKRPIPFQNIIYVGDGMTDVPCMTVTKKNGGHAIAVHKPHHSRSLATCRTLLKAGRIDFFAPADYQSGSRLEHRFKLILDMIIARIAYQRELFSANKT